MPTFDQHPSSDVVKMLVLGNSGAGKSGLLATLASKYKLFIADFDSGLDILSDPSVLTPEFRKNVYYKTFYDKSILNSGVMLPKAEGFSDYVNNMNDWKEDGQSLGGIYSWGSDVCFITDSLTFMGNCALNYQLKLVNRLGAKPQIQDFGAAIDLQETTLETLYNPAVKCHIIVTAHLVSLVDDTQGNVTKLFPSGLGKKFPPKIGRYFNNVVMIEKVGMGKTVKRQLQTTGTHNVDLKVSKPSKISPIFEPDLLKLFEILLGKE